jgi:hypothetical protein
MIAHPPKVPGNTLLLFLVKDWRVWEVIQQKTFKEYIAAQVNRRLGRRALIVEVINDGIFWPFRKTYNLLLETADTRTREGPFQHGKRYFVRVVQKTGEVTNPNTGAVFVEFPPGYPGGDAVPAAFQVIEEEFNILILILQSQPDALPRLSRLSVADEDNLKTHMKEIKRWSEVYSWRQTGDDPFINALLASEDPLEREQGHRLLADKASIEELEIDEINTLIMSENPDKREQGRQRAQRVLESEKEIKALERRKLALQLLYQNQYREFLQNYGFLGDVYAGPRGACSIT